jgi:hypothetical protein
MAVYDPNTPAIAQNDPWSCAPTSARWAMTAWGRRPTEQWFESTMLAEGVVSTDLGLLDASGAGLAAWLTKEYGEFGFAARNNGHVSFDDVKSVAGQSPVLIGGRQWNHWSGVRSYDPITDTLQLANPSSGWMNVYQTMNRQRFDALGPFSMVVVTWQDPAPPAPAPKPPAPTPAPVPPSFRVGAGVLAEMARRGDEPITSEIYHKDDAGANQYSATIGRSGSTYLYAFSTGRVYVTHTDATAEGRS